MLRLIVSKGTPHSKPGKDRSNLTAFELKLMTIVFPSENCCRVVSLLALLVFVASAQAEGQWVDYKGHDGPGHGKRIVLISGDEEYRSEEALPQLGKILRKPHGVACA